MNTYPQKINTRSQKCIHGTHGGCTCLVEDTVFFEEVSITTCYSSTRMTNCAHMNGHWKVCDSRLFAFTFKNQYSRNSFESLSAEVSYLYIE